MKNFIVLLSACIFCINHVSGQQKDSSDRPYVRVILKNANPGTVYLRTYISDKLVTVDSVVGGKNDIILRGLKSEEEQSYNLDIGNFAFFRIILSDTSCPEIHYDATAKYSMDDLNSFYSIFRKSESTLEYNKLTYDPIAWQRQRISLKSALEDANRENKIDSLTYLIKNFYRHKVQNSSSPVVVDIAMNFLKREAPEDDFNAIGVGLKKRFPNSKLVANAVAWSLAPPLENKVLAVGTNAPVFDFKTMDGAEASLANFRGSYVLIDFWASWCQPCRQETPFLKKAYAKYKKKNFKIVSMSVDKRKDVLRWKQAILDDGASEFIHSLDTAGNNRISANSIYGIQTIPTNYLINPEGKIIAINLRGEQLEKSLDTVFKGSRD